MKPNSSQWREVYLCVALTTMATLLLELALTRIFSVVFYYHFAFLAISIALFGLGLGGVFSYVVAGWKAPLFTRLGRLSVVNSLLVIVALAVLLAQGDNLSNWDLALVYFTTALPFFTAGAIVSLAISETIAAGQPDLFLRSHRRRRRMPPPAAVAQTRRRTRYRDRRRRHLRRRRRHLAQPGGVRQRARRQRRPGPRPGRLPRLQPEAPRAHHPPRQRPGHRQ